jgi:hypothetical protein
MRVIVWGGRATPLNGDKAVNRSEETATTETQTLGILLSVNGDGSRVAAVVGGLQMAEWSG